jgi:ABC-type uncharacterized transport system substrate-binding protein
MKRRDFIAGVAGAAAWPLALRAQQLRMSRIGLVMGYAESDPAAQEQVVAFRQELEKLGWTEGRNITIDVRYAIAGPDQIRAIAVELMGLRPDLMVANSNLVMASLQPEVRTVPLMFIGVADPIGSGFVTNIARPSGNVTGFANWDSSMGGKWLEILKAISPQVEYVGFVLHPETAANVDFLNVAKAAAPSLKIEVIALGVHNADEIARVVSAFAARPNCGLVISPHAVTLVNRDLIIELSARYRSPTIYSFAFYAKSGGLVSYGFDPIDQFRQGATYVNRILRGAKPAELPVQYPTKFQLVINMKTAKAFGLTVPETLLIQADEVIQ